jgi:ribonuclease HI
MLDAESHLVIHQEVLHRKEEGCSSNSMELKGFVKCLEKLEKKWTIKTVTTDRNNSITKLMENKNIIHLFDLWHIVKSIKNLWRTVRRNEGSVKNYKKFSANSWGAEKITLSFRNLK